MFHVEHRISWQEALIEGCSKLEIPIEGAILNQLGIYLGELRSWNRKFNLSGLEDPIEIAVKHFLDSLVAAKILKDRPGDSVLDIGSGAGFPGLPLKLIFPSLSFQLLEPSSKKTAFLRHVIGTLDLKGIVVTSNRLQDLAREPSTTERYQYALTRAVSLTEIISIVPTILARGGKLILWRTKAQQPHIAMHDLRQVGELPYTLPHFGERKLIIFEKQVLAK